MANPETTVTVRSSEGGTTSVGTTTLTPPRTWPSLIAMFFDQAERLSERPLAWSKLEGEYRPVTWGEAAHRARALARALRHEGIQPGDRVVIQAENRPEWLIADMAIMAAGGISVPAYTTNTVRDNQHILDDSGAKGVIVSRQGLFERVLPAALQAESCRFIVAIDAVDRGMAGEIVLRSWDDMIAEGEKDPAPVEDWVAEIGAEDTACLIYTSGTGGAPKGVMQTHHSIFANCYGAYELLEAIGIEDEVFLSFLPLSHSYEHTAGQMFPLIVGAQIYYAEGIETLATNLTEAKPTLLIAVPRLFESMRQRIQRQLERQGGVKKHLIERAVQLGRKQIEQGRLNPFEATENAFLDRMVRKSVQERFGGRVKAFVAGGAALTPEVGLFFQALGVPVYQGYGQTEASPVLTANRPGKVKMHTVGPPLPGVEIRIGADGEILARGDMLMKGYWQREQETRETIVDGWLHTGDIGHIDEDGYLTITDRKKNIIVNSGGDNISPTRVEGELELRGEIVQSMVYGDKKPYLVALIVPDQEWAKAWAEHRGKTTDMEALVKDEAFQEALGQAVDTANKELSQIYRVRRFRIVPTPFTIESGMMTPTLKLRRHIIEAHYKDDLEGLYSQRSAA